MIGTNAITFDSEVVTGGNPVKLHARNAEYSLIIDTVPTNKVYNPS